MAGVTIWFGTRKWIYLSIYLSISLYLSIYIYIYIYIYNHIRMCICICICMYIYIYIYILYIHIYIYIYIYTYIDAYLLSFFEPISLSFWWNFYINIIKCLLKLQINLTSNSFSQICKSFIMINSPWKRP